MTSSEAPSSISSTSRPPAGGGTSPSRGPGSNTRGGSGCARAGPRSTVGITTEMSAVSTRIVALARPPRRLMWASAIIRNTAAGRRHDDRARRHAPCRLDVEHRSEAAEVQPHHGGAAAAAIVNSHESSRTLSQPGDSTSTARIWRMTMRA